MISLRVLDLGYVENAELSTTHQQRQKKFFVTVLCSEMVNILGVALSSSRCGLMILVCALKTMENPYEQKYSRQIQ